MEITIAQNDVPGNGITGSLHFSLISGSVGGATIRTLIAVDATASPNDLAEAFLKFISFCKGASDTAYTGEEHGQLCSLIREVQQRA
jgi:hypothetical protein